MNIIVILKKETKTPEKLKAKTSDITNISHYEQLMRNNIAWKVRYKNF